MKTQHIVRVLSIVVAAMFWVVFQGGTWAIAQEATPSDENGVEVLTRGPVHEAFAEPTEYNPAQGAVVPKQSPDPIEGIPPDEKPDEDAVWIPGYWQWDFERADFIWVSGVWRVPPPGCSWVPGYYTETEKGWVWTPGFWMAAENNEEVEYLPQPPESLEVGPSSPAPSEDYLWTPGCWVWVENRYAWRPGYWLQARPDWVWAPPYYVRTPRGCIFVEGYWDLPLERRGLLFAPVYFTTAVYAQPNYSYSPSIVIQIDILTSCLFISPHHHFYFGDYYGNQYSQRGFRPWFEVYRHQHGYDPIFAHELWNHHRRDAHWASRLRNDYNYRINHADARPARTYSAQARTVAHAPESSRSNLLVAASVSDVAARRTTLTHFQKINEGQRKSYINVGKELSKFRVDRAKWESRAEITGVNQPTRPTLINPEQTRVPRTELPRKPGEIQPVTPPREPIHVQPNLTPKSPVQFPTSRTPGKPGEVQSPRQTRIGQPQKEFQLTAPQMQRIERSPIFGKPIIGTPGQGGNPPMRPESPRPDMSSRPRGVKSNKTK